MGYLRQACKGPDTGVTVRISACRAGPKGQDLNRNALNNSPWRPTHRCLAAAEKNRTGGPWDHKWHRRSGSRGSRGSRVGMAAGRQLGKGGHQGGDTLRPVWDRLQALQGSGSGETEEAWLEFLANEDCWRPGEGWSPRSGSNRGTPECFRSSPWIRTTSLDATTLSPTPRLEGTREEPQANPAPSPHSQTGTRRSLAFPVPLPAPPLDFHWLRRQGPAPALPLALDTASTYRLGRARLTFPL